MTRLARPAALAAALALTVALAGCSGSGGSAAASGASPAATASGPHGTLTVFAAASLTDSFNDLATAFEKKYPAVTVKPIDYDGSSTLATQLIQGAHADVFASADQMNIAKVADAGDLSGTSKTFTSNVLQIAVQPGNPKHITGLKSLADPKLKVVECAPEVPCGAASQKMLKIDKVSLKPVSQEQNVTAVITKVETGDADAGLVYVTDVTAAGSKADGVDIENAAKATNFYGIGVPASAQNPAAGKAFITFVLSDAGQAVLKKYGFGAP